MTGIAFYFENNDVDVFSGRVIDLAAWSYAAKIGGVDSLVIVNKTANEIKTPDRALNVEIVSELPELPNAAIMVTPWDLDDPEEHRLYDSDHDFDWYIFGPASGWRRRFPAGTPLTLLQSSMGAAHAVHVATAAMFHRHHVLGG